MASSTTPRCAPSSPKIGEVQAAPLSSALLKDYQRLVRLEVEKHHADHRKRRSRSMTARATQLENTLRSQVRRRSTTEFKVTPELIGGLRIKIGSDVFDTPSASASTASKANSLHA